MQFHDLLLVQAGRFVQSVNCTRHMSAKARIHNGDHAQDVCMRDMRCGKETLEGTLLPNTMASVFGRSVRESCDCDAIHAPKESERERDPYCSE